MKVNVSQTDSALRFLLGLLLTFWVVAGGPFWAWFGVYLLATSAYRLCPTYLIFNLRTVNEQKRELE